MGSQVVLALLRGRIRKDLKLRSGMLWLCGLGTLLSTTAPFAGTTSWTCASSAKPTRPPPPARSAQWLGECATMPSISTASPAGSRLARCVPWITATGSSRNTATSQFQKARQDVEVDRRRMLTHMLAHYFLPKPPAPQFDASDLL